MGSTTMREGVQPAAAAAELDVRGRGAGKQTRTDGLGGDDATPAGSLQLRSAGGPRGGGGAGDWEMDAGLMAAMGLGGYDGGGGGSDGGRLRH